MDLEKAPLGVEVYVSVDVETDGPIPGPYSMLSFGAAAFSDSGKLIDTFTRNLRTLEGAAPHPETMTWWKAHQEAYLATRQEQESPGAAIVSFVKWVDELPGRPVFVAYPAGFDFTFMYWYMMMFAGRSPFSFSALDIKSFAMATLGLPYRQSTKRYMPREWFSGRKHTHLALDDAIEQGELFMAMRLFAAARLGNSNGC